jgi:DNA-binding IclR family transcriptional regulator
MTGKTEGAQSITRAALLLRTLATFGSTGASLLQISTLTGLPKATAHRILSAMMDERLVERPAGTRHYRLGPDIFAFGIAVRESFDLKRFARPSIERLASETGVAIYLGVRSGYDMLCLDMADGASEQQPLLLEVNDRWPLGIGAFSLALFAFLPESEIEGIIEFNQRRIREEDELTFKHIHRSIQKTRRNGYAKRTMRSYRGLSGIAAPVFDDRHYPIASLCAVTAASRMNGSFLTGLSQKLVREATLISKLYESGRLQQQQQENWRLAVRNPSGAYLTG